MEKKRFETQDIWLSTFLYMCGLVPILKMRQDTVVFAFPASSDLDRLIVNFNNNVSVPSLDFVNAHKLVRGRMHDLKHGRDRV